MGEDILRRPSHKPLSLQQNIGHIVRNHGLYRARKVSCGELGVALRGIWARVIDAQIHLNKRSHGLQCLFDLQLVPARNSALHVLPQVLQCVVDEAIAGKRIVNKWVIGVERLPLGLDVCGIDADDGIQCRTGNLMIPLLCVAPSKRHPD